MIILNPIDEMKSRFVSDRFFAKTPISRSRDSRQEERVKNPVSRFERKMVRDVQARNTGDCTHRWEREVALDVLHRSRRCRRVQVFSVYRFGSRRVPRKLNKANPLRIGLQGVLWKRYPHIVVPKVFEKRERFAL